MLSSERYPYNGDAKKDAEKQVRQHNPKTAKDEPDDVHYGRQTTGVVWVRCYSDPKWRQADHRKLKTLQAEWDAYNRQAKDQSADNIFEENKYSAKDDPNDVSN